MWWHLILSSPMKHVTPEGTQPWLIVTQRKQSEGSPEAGLELLCVLSEASVGVDAQRQQLDFARRLAETLQGSLRIVERQLYYDLDPDMEPAEVNCQVAEAVRAFLGGSSTLQGQLDVRSEGHGLQER